MPLHLLYGWWFDVAEWFRAMPLGIPLGIGGFLVLISLGNLERQLREIAQTQHRDMEELREQLTSLDEAIREARQLYALMTDETSGTEHEA